MAGGVYSVMEVTVVGLVGASPCSLRSRPPSRAKGGGGGVCCFSGVFVMAQVWIDIEDNGNCGYFPMQTFEARGVEMVADSVVLEEVSGVEGRCEVIGWSDEGSCEIRVVAVGDSGAGESILIHGGNNGIRLRQEGSMTEWALDAAEQFGEPYMLLPTGSEIEFLGLKG